MSEEKKQEKISQTISSLAKDDEFRTYKYSVLTDFTQDELDELKKIRNEIIKKIQLVLNNVTPQALKRASLSSRGTTLKSLMNAFHIVQLHLKTEEQDTLAKNFNSELFRAVATLSNDDKRVEVSTDDEKHEDVLQSIQNYIAIQKKTFIKQKRFE